MDVLGRAVRDPYSAAWVVLVIWSSTPIPSGGIATGWLNAFQSDISNFVNTFLVARIVTTVAAYFVLRAILDTASGGHPLPSILAAMFLLGTQAT